MKKSAFQIVNLFKEPAEPFALFTYTDFAILFLIFLIQYFLFTRKVIYPSKMIKVILALMLFIFIPWISAKKEVMNVHDKYEMVDGFNLVYIYFKFPVWWIIGSLNFYLLGKYSELRNQ